MDEVDVEMIIILFNGEMNMRRDETEDENEFFDLQNEARRKMKYHLIKREHGKNLKKQLQRMFTAWDEQEGGESALNCLDITAITQQAINEYLNKKS